MFEVKVGDEVGFGRYGRFNYHSTGFARVTKINGHGHITLDNGKIFDKHGREYKNTHYGIFLVNAEDLRRTQAADLAAREQRARVNALEVKVKELYNGYSGHAHVTPELKAELLALVEAL